ncbi:MAG: hypothetical protein Q4G42_00950 [Neisseria sp.]|nr:hypothetical protein [Neisseria sp.]
MKKSTVLRLWLWAIVAVVLFFGLLTQCSMKKPEIINRVVADCSKNIPFSPVWQQDLVKYGIDPQQAGLPEYYCQCVLGDAMQKLSDKEVSDLAQMSEAERLTKLGGAAAIQQRNDACLAKRGSQAASQ